LDVCRTFPEWRGGAVTQGGGSQPDNLLANTFTQFKLIFTDDIRKFGSEEYFHILLIVINVWYI
jgi:hypothetical protein